MGRALMRHLLGGAAPDDYVAPVRLIERASVQQPVIGRTGAVAAQ
jgi:hypothetical protein